MSTFGPWVTIIIVAIWAFGKSVRQSREFKGVQWYPLFCALASLIQLVIYIWWRKQYYLSFWSFQFAHNIFLCFLAIEIISRLVHKTYAVLWAVAAFLAFFSILALTLADKVDNAAKPLKLSALFLDISTSCVITAGLLMTLLLAIRVNRQAENSIGNISIWSKILGNFVPLREREHAIATVGVLLILLGDYVSSKMWGNATFVQLAPLAGLILMALAGSTKRTWT